MGSREVSSVFYLPSFISSQLPSFPLYPLAAGGKKLTADLPILPGDIHGAAFGFTLDGVDEAFF
jgi:hypothetical protein